MRRNEGNFTVQRLGTIVAAYLAMYVACKVYLPRYLANLEGSKGPSLLSSVM